MGRWPGELGVASAVPFAPRSLKPGRKGKMTKVLAPNATSSKHVGELKVLVLDVSPVKDSLSLMMRSGLQMETISTYCVAVEFAVYTFEKINGDFHARTTAWTGDAIMRAFLGPDAFLHGWSAAPPGDKGAADASSAAASVAGVASSSSGGADASSSGGAARAAVAAPLAAEPPLPPAPMAALTHSRITKRSGGDRAIEEPLGHRHVLTYTYIYICIYMYIYIVNLCL